jgi:hypothetical protein
MKLRFKVVTLVFGLFTVAGMMSAVVNADDVRWKKPNQLASYSNSNIVQVVFNEQFEQVDAVQIPAAPTPMTPAQLDTVYPERRPQAQEVVIPSAPLPQLAPTAYPIPTIDPSTVTPVSPAQVGDNSAAGSRVVNTIIKCPTDIGIRPIREVNYDIRTREGGLLPHECPLAPHVYQPRQFSLTCYRWKAAALCTKGAYFEDIQRERYGHTLCPALQPVCSGVRFLADIVLLPYKMGLETPNECVYTLGHYRVGNCAPHTLDPLPLSLRGALFETGAVVGAAYLIP